MSIFGKKKEADLEDLCRDFYENHILNQTVGGVDLSNVFPDYVKKSISEADDVFIKVDSNKLADEIMILRFELFALAWIHRFGIDLAIKQSIFTKHYLYEKEKGNIWNTMEHYNKAIAHASIVDNPSVLTMRADLADKMIKEFERRGVKGDESVGMPINRMFSEKAWKKRITSYFLLLALCHRLGLGYGSDYLGPNKEAQFRLQAFIYGLYEGADQAFDNIKIITKE